MQLKLINNFEQGCSPAKIFLEYTMIHVLNRGKFKSSKNNLDLIFLINIRWECFMGIGLTRAGFSTKSCASDSELFFLGFFFLRVFP